MAGIAEFVIGKPRRILLGLGAATLLLVTFIPSIDFNDQWTQYFDERVEFRRDTDQALEIETFGETKEMLESLLQHG